MKKFFCLVAIILLTTCGCTVEYNLTIDDLESFTYQESAELVSYDIDEFMGMYDSIWPTNAYNDQPFESESYEKLDGVDYYEVESYYDGEYHMKFSFNFPSNRFSYSTGIATIYPNFTVTYNETDNTTTIDTKSFIGSSLYPYLEELTVNVTINNTVVSHNATYVNGNVYTWVITDLDNSRLVLTYENVDNTYTVKDSSRKLVYVIIAFVVILIIFIIVVNKWKEKKRNG